MRPGAFLAGQRSPCRRGARADKRPWPGSLASAAGLVASRAGLIASAAGLIALLGLPRPVAAQTSLIQSGRFTLDLGGYVNSLTGVHDTGYDLPEGERRSGFHGDVIRLKWRAAWGDAVVLDVHDRIQSEVSSSPAGFGSSVAGFGVSAPPGHSVHLESVWIDDERLRLLHDLDRLSVTVYSSLADVTIGRQAITWGTSLLFPVADLWAQFSPFELDTEEKPGVDAVRILSYPTSELQIDAVVADRGRGYGASAALRATWSLSKMDVYAAAGRLWEEAVAMGGVTWPFDTWTLRGEAVASRNLDTDRWLTPRFTIGVDRLGSPLSLTAEYHFNGLGAGSAEGYLDRLQGKPFARGETYFLGRQYLGLSATVAVDPQERIHVSATVLANLADPSEALLPVVTWDVGRSARLSLGGLVGLGDTPTFDGDVPQIRSEYGTYGSLGYAQVAVFF